MALLDEFNCVIDNILCFPRLMRPQMGGGNFVLAQAANNFIGWHNALNGWDNLLLTKVTMDFCSWQ
jgi:hypothetical protein